MPRPSSYVEMLMPNVVVLGGGVFRKCLGHENRAFMNEIGALTKEAPEKPLAASAMWGHNEKSVTLKRALTKHGGTVTSELQLPETWEINFHCL